MSVTMGKEHRLRAFKERLVEEIWTSQKVSKNWRTLHVEEVNYWYFSTDNY